MPGEKPPCEFNDCGRRGRARRDGVMLCSTHYNAAREGRPLKPIKPMLKRGTYAKCGFEGCGRPHSSGGYCATHYQQQNDGKPLTPIRGWVRQAEWPSCRYGDCKTISHSRGLCIVHYGRGISQFARDAILVLQGGRCLCGTETPGAEGWELDHDHACAGGHLPHNYCLACVRGMLCVPCNRRGVSWYEGTWKPQGNALIPWMEAWITRRIRFDGDPNSPDVEVAYVLPARAPAAASTTCSDFTVADHR